MYDKTHYNKKIKKKKKKKKEGKVLITGPQGKSPEDPPLSSLTWLLAGGDTERKRDKEIQMKRESTRLKL